MMSGCQYAYAALSNQNLHITLPTNVLQAVVNKILQRYGAVSF